MLKIDTERLNVFPLDKPNLELCISDFNEMEKSLGLIVTGRSLSDREKNVYKMRLTGVQNNPTNYMWHTVWIVVLKEVNRYIGTVMVKNYPNQNGEVIIGYSIESEYRCKGFMTEALNHLSQWLFSNPEVKFILADTLKNNIASQRVLQKIGMINYMEDDECFWWRLSNYCKE